ncbi:MAG TPA: pimeloyl-[acyl-carrier protein] methyl ester esterase [Gammaproteobacteria bacterium]|nr:pimeloyl-[acyl-carrier protein] methyl ester esterase [Gammaproteobacteria bacterium]
MNVYSEQFGFGPDIVLLHGWGLHSGVWSSIAEKLSESWRVTLIDLPGHGRSRDPDPDTPFDLDTVSAAVAAAAPPRATWIGWSLGGLFASKTAIEHPDRVSRLVLVASSPRFVTAPDWPHAMEPQVLKAFGDSLENDYTGTLERFIGLQVAAGSDRARETLRKLRAQLFRHPPPPPGILRGGLRLLEQADLRPRMGRIMCPTLLIYGARDAIVPAGVGRALRQQLPLASLKIIERAGHAPFLSHPREFMTALSRFLHDDA